MAAGAGEFPSKDDAAAAWLPRSPWWIVGPLLLLEVGLLRTIQLQCSSYNDLGIYSEALRRITLQDWNPWIPGRGVHIFADHFDPILVPVALLGRSLPAPLLGIGVEFLAIALCWLPLGWLRDAGRISHRTALFSYAFLVLNDATIDAVQTPFHPTTWGMLPLVAVFACYALERWRAMLVALIALFACREEFPLVGISLGLVLLFERRFGIGAMTLALSALWLGFVFGMRPHLMGATVPYGPGLLGDFLAHPLAVFDDEFHPRSMRTFLARMGPLMLVLTWPSLWRHRRWLVKALIVAAPLLAVRFASSQWAFHYGTAAVIAVLFVTLPALDEARVVAWRKRASWALLLMLFLSPVVKNLWDGYLSEERFRFGHGCPPDRARLDRLKQARQWIAESGRRKILVENNLAVMLLMDGRREQEVYIVGGPHDPRVLPFEVVLVEKSPRGDPWPIGRKRMDELVQVWRSSPGIRVVLDSREVLLAEGAIAVDR
jgi:predicted membrane protein DUF2079